MIHELPLEQRTLHGHFSRDLEPVLAIEPGDSVRIAVPNAGWFLDSGEQFVSRDPSVDTGHALAGPIEVRGARIGGTLEVRIDEVHPGPWGWTGSEPPHELRWTLDGGVGRTGERAVRLAPFLGVLGMPPPETGQHSTTPPRRSGGNIDCKELVAGSTLFLPIPVDGALFSAGDGHAAQGDGEVAGTAIECPARAQLTIDIRDELQLDWPIAQTSDAWLTFGFDQNLGPAARIALDGMLQLMQRELGLDHHEAFLFASVVVDLRITQLVNDAVGVHAVLRHDAIR